MDVWNTRFPFWNPIFRCYASFRECISWIKNRVEFRANSHFKAILKWLLSCAVLRIISGGVPDFLSTGSWYRYTPENITYPSKRGHFKRGRQTSSKHYFSGATFKLRGGGKGNHSQSTKDWRQPNQKTQIPSPFPFRYHRENGGINPIYTLYSGYLLGISPFKGLWATKKNHLTFHWILVV